MCSTPRGSARTAQPRVGLQGIDHLHEIVEADDPFELESGALVGRPDQVGLDPADLRKKNFINKFPHQTPVIMAYDAGDYNASLKKAMELADYKGIGKRNREAARLCGISARACPPCASRPSVSRCLRANG